MENCCREVHELHAFFEAWFQGTVAGTDDVLARFKDVLADEFEMVMPDGTEFAKGAIVERLSAGYKMWGPGRTIRIDGCRARDVAPGLWLVRYDEWQEGGPEPTVGIRSVALMREGAGPNGLAWVHVHEAPIQS